MTGVFVIQVTARIEAHTAQRRELAQALLQWAAAARRESGSLEADVYEDVKAANIFCLLSQWTSRIALEAHLRGPVFGSMLGAVELLADQSAVAVTEATDQANASTTLRRLRDSWRHAGAGDADVIRFQERDEKRNEERDV